MRRTYIQPNHTNNANKHEAKIQAIQANNVKYMQCKQASKSFIQSVKMDTAQGDPRLHAQDKHGYDTPQEGALPVQVICAAI